MKTGIELIEIERARQMTHEGWTAQHDDDHDAGELAQAAACYAMPDAQRPTKAAVVPGSPRSPAQRVRIPHRWPWDAEWWRPTPDDRVRELVKAGALIAAEIDRLQRIQ
jgi:hypothetical protein